MTEMEPVWERIRDRIIVKREALDRDREAKILRRLAPKVPYVRPQQTYCKRGHAYVFVDGRHGPCLICNRMKAREWGRRKRAAR